MPAALIRDKSSFLLFIFKVILPTTTTPTKLEKQYTHWKKEIKQQNKNINK